MLSNRRTIRIVLSGSVAAAVLVSAAGGYGAAQAGKDSTATAPPGPSHQPPADPPADPPTADPPAEAPADPPGSDLENMEADVDAAVSVVDEFWRAHWSDLFTRRYSSPQVFGFYDGASGPACGRDAAAENNAFYCSYGDFLAWDQTLMSTGYATGDAFVYYVVAHEWGHAIQARLEPSLSGNAPELQADCLAAAALYGSVADGTLEFEPGDENELARAMSDVGDDTPWTDPADHGTALERLGAFNRGRSGGVKACLPTG
jgi:predicted metalloprotease